MNPNRLALLRAGLALWLAVSAAAAAPAVLALHVRFAPSETPAAVVATDIVSGKPLEIRHASAGIRTRHGWAAVFTGHPDQGLVLGNLGLQPPVTIALWVRRAREPHVFPGGERHPEYVQEHAAGDGRLLSPLTGRPSDAGRLSGILRLGPGGVEVWHGTQKWNRVVTHALPVGQWLHLVVTFDADQRATGYLNGRPAGTTQSGFNFGDGPMALAAAALERGYGFPFAGAIDEVRFYRGVLGQTEIDALAASSPAP